MVSYERLTAILDSILLLELTMSSVILSVTLGSSLTKNLTFQYTLINLPVVATINFASCVLFLVPYLMMQLLPWSMLLLLVGSIIAARF